ncbi:hypothetical protein SLEP1_g2574 [Rubroshorea leprosula]|uniref:Reverse transcriptase domain-containing protein n=1 Tax=Rubroshorea leprosula TaxID=152421 RepID=A0AAV5HRC6_9ROSI|nr:hypothetical protein SLEP1_g2574 [Rubroshorea leprosula]
MVSCLDVISVSVVIVSLLILCCDSAFIAQWVDSMVFALLHDGFHLAVARFRATVPKKWKIDKSRPLEMDTDHGGRRRHGNGNSATGFKDFANRLPAFDRGLLKQCESFHFVNFPEDWGAKQLFYFIRTIVKAGRLWYIFIPSKRDRRGNRYGFARFLDARNEQEMKKQLGNIWIGNQRVVFNSAVERRKEKRSMEAKPAEEASWKSNKRTITAEDKNTMEEGSRKIPRMTYAQCLLQQKEMANSTETGNKDPTPSESKEFPRRSIKGTPKTPSVSRPLYKKVIELKDTDEAEDKLMKCAIGVVLTPSIIPNLPEIFFNEGFPSIKIAPMGGNLVLIDDEDPEHVKELVDGNLQWVAAYFDRVKYWAPSDIAEERFVWVRIQGLPIHAWSKESLSTIGNHVGKLVSIDEYTLSKECLDAARILVSTKSKLAINEDFILKVKNNSFHIAVVEENWRTDPWNERLELWADLQKMIEEDDGFWCIAGDFNSVRSEEEKRGRKEHSRFREDLNGFIESAGLNDLPLTRRKFTWYKSNGSAMSRLDRFLISDDLLTFWGDCCQFGLNRTISDHCPVILKMVNSDWGPKPFTTLNCWDQHPDFIRVVEDIWKTTEVGGWSGYVCKEKFKQLRNKLKTWNIEVFGNYEHQIAVAEAKIKGVDSKNEDNEITEEDILLRREGFSELWEAWQRREVAWKQKTMLDWVKQGDANSKLFHRIASGNRNRKLIRGLYKNGSWMEEPNTVKQEVRDYFKNIFQEEKWDRPKLDGLQFKQLDDEDKLWLERDISAEDVKQAVWECGGDKSPGPDGFSFHLIRSFWSVIEKYIVNFVQEFSSNGKLVLANRIKKVISKVISGAQSAFLGGRQITDGILILNEVVEEIKRKKASSFIFKADFEKAYDCMNWNFLDEMMWRLGFGEKWRKWIKKCLQTASVIVLINGSPTDEFKMERGIRQGDPITPFLFLIVAEGLNGLIEAAVSKDLFQGVDIGPFGLNISHLQFADDTVIMGKADPTNIKAVKGILRWFELVSGLKINFNKSVLYSFHVSDEWGRMVAATLNCKSGSIPFTYLGMPIGDVMCRRKSWIPIIDNFKEKNRLAWLSWEKVCRGEKEGGLGVPNLEYRNIALLGKWWNRFGKEENSLWKTVISNKYYGGVIKWDIKQFQVRKLPSLWGNIVAIGKEGGKGSLVLRDGFIWKLGMGDKIKFWCDKWVGIDSLDVSFPRLFNLASNQNANVMEVGQISNGLWIWRNAWRREPFGRERNEERLLKESLTGGITFSTQPDQRIWSFDTANGYTVGKAYSMMAGQNNILEPRICTRLWNRLVPIKVSCFG